MKEVNLKKQSPVIVTAEEQRYSKTQLLKSERYQGKTDILEALLEKEKQYTINKVNEQVEKFLKRKVK